MAAGLGLGVAGRDVRLHVDASSGTRTPPGGTHAPPGNGGTQPTVGGKITALDGDDIVVQSRDDDLHHRRLLVRHDLRRPSRARTARAPRRAAPRSRSARFIGVEGTKNDDGTVTASSVTIGGPPPDATGGPPLADSRGGQGRPGQLRHPARRAPSA